MGRDGPNPINGFSIPADYCHVNRAVPIWQSIFPRRVIIGRDRSYRGRC